MATIASVPNELLIEIFKYYLPLPKGSLDFHDDLRFIIAAVCSDWRTLILHERQLWTAININARSVIPRLLGNVQDSNVPPSDIFCRPVIAFACAGSFPVSLTIDIPSDNKYFGAYHADLLSRTLHDEASRIESLTILGDDWGMHLCVLHGLLQQPMPLLHSFTHIAFTEHDVCEYESFEELTHLSDTLLHILQYPFEDEDTDLETVNQWGRELYPNLTYLEISGAPYDFDLLPTTGLRELRLTDQPDEERPTSLHLADMLSFCGDTLEELYITDFLESLPNDYDNSDPVIFFHLKKLFLTYQDPISVTKFLPFIRTPVLEELEIADRSRTYMDGSDEEDELEDEELVSSDGLLGALMHSLPLGRLEKLSFSSIIFKDAIKVPERDAFLVKGQVYPSDVPFTLRFLLALTSLKELDIMHPGKHILPLLNYPRVPSFGLDGEALHDGGREIPSRHLAHLPSLDTLYLGIGMGDITLIQKFVDNRVDHTVLEKPLHVVVNRAIIAAERPGKPYLSFETVKYPVG